MSPRDLVRFISQKHGAGCYILTWTLKYIPTLKWSNVFASHNKIHVCMSNWTRPVEVNINGDISPFKVESLCPHERILLCVLAESLSAMHVICLSTFASSSAFLVGEGQRGGGGRLGDVRRHFCGAWLPGHAGCCRCMSGRCWRCTKPSCDIPLHH